MYCKCMTKQKPITVFYQRQKRNSETAKIWHNFVFAYILWRTKLRSMSFSENFMLFFLVTLGAAPPQARRGRGFSKVLVHLIQCSMKANRTSWKCNKMLQFWPPIKLSLLHYIRCENTLKNCCSEILSPFSQSLFYFPTWNGQFVAVIAQHRLCNLLL